MQNADRFGLVDSAFVILHSAFCISTMLVTITAIHGDLATHTVVEAARPATAVARVPVSFEAGPVSGLGFLFWSNSINAGAMPPDPLIGTPFEADVSFRAVSRFR